MQIINFNYELHSQKVWKLWNEVVSERDFYKQFTFEGYDYFLFKNPHFKAEGAFVALDGEEVIGFAVGMVRNEDFENPDAPGYFNTIIVKKEYQRQGIGSKLLKEVEEYFVKCNRKAVRCVFYSPVNWPWYIPNTDHHDHPCAPGIRVNSNEYFFLLHNRYEATGFQDAFHLALADYEISESISEILEENKKNGVTIEIYNPEIHSGVEEFCRELNIYDFEKVIKENLALEKPYPFLVVVKDGKVKGWTGAMWNEESGRGHFDGIAILESVRGKGLGKALFSLLAYHSKLNGAKFMTFYTGLTNHARYIYMGAGFKIIQSFAVMKKKIKK